MIEKFRIVLATPEAMDREYPLRREQRLANEATEKDEAIFFVQSQGDRITNADLSAQVNGWNRDNIIEIILRGELSDDFSWTAAASLGVLVE